MKRILHISKLYAPNEGGIEKISKLVVESLPGYEHKVICFSSNTKSYTDIFNGVTIERVGVPFSLFSQQISLKFFFSLLNLIRQYKPDLIHFHAPNPLVMLYLNILKPRACKLIIHWHSDIIEQALLYKVVQPIERLMLRKADSIIATSPNYIAHSKPLAPFASKVTVVPCAINPAEYDKKKIDLQRWQNIAKKYEDKKIVFFVGRHVTYKGLTYLIKAEKFIKNDCVILIGGTGPLTRQLSLENKSTRIKFLGRLSDEDLLVYHHLADVFVLPSITKNEAFGLVLAEAMFCETPAITFTIDGSGVNWVNLNGVTGLEVENGNADKLAKGIDELLTDDELRARFAANAKSRVEENFVVGLIDSKLKRLYEGLIG
jgi:glycosyltransferase involved in cell wall biosynthesis